MSENPRSYSSTESVPHGIFPLQVELLSQAKLKMSADWEINALNNLLIGATTSFIENFMANVLDNLCLKSRSLSKNDRIHCYYITTIRTKIKKGNLSDYKQLINTLTGKGFDKYSNQDSWVGVDNLFRLRNQILHGKTIKIEYFSEKQHPYYKCGLISGMEDVQKYLNGKKLLPTDRHLHTYDILSNKVMHHFMTQSLKFVTECHNAINSEFETVPVFTLERSLRQLDETLQSIKDQ